MEEKKRYEKIYFDNETRFKIIDNITEQNIGGIDSMIKILNQQDKRIEHLNNIISEIDVDFTIKQYNELKKENQQLKQQLEEKEKEIEKVKKSKTYIMNFGSKVKEVQVVDDNQDKISFAVEQLTQAIKNIKKCNYKDFGIMYQSDAIAVIDQQIELLKGKVEDVKD